MSSDISLSPTCEERAAAAWSSSGELQPLRRRMTYRFMGVLSGDRDDRRDHRHAAGHTNPWAPHTTAAPRRGDGMRGRRVAPRGAASWGSWGLADGEAGVATR